MQKFFGQLCPLIVEMEMCHDISEYCAHDNSKYKSKGGQNLFIVLFYNKQREIFYVKEKNGMLYDFYLYIRLPYVDNRPTCLSAESVL